MKKFFYRGKIHENIEKNYLSPKNPLSVFSIALATRHLLDVQRIDQFQLKARFPKDVP
jgi:hypothetical protein